jgi:hypothetical protein
MFDSSGGDISRKRAAIAIRLILSVALVQMGCRREPHHKKPPPPPPNLCPSQTQGSDLVVSSSARTQVGKTWFDATFSSKVNVLEHDKSGTTETHLQVRRNSVVALSLDTLMTPKGAIEVYVTTGDGFHGIKKVAFTTRDRGETIHGTIDGKPIAPFSGHDKRESIKLASGAKPASSTIDDDVKIALPVLMRAIQQQCPSAPTPFILPQGPGGGGGDPPAHYSYPDKGSACSDCLGGATAGLGGCLAIAAAVSVECLVFYAVCFAAAVIVCLAAYLVTLTTGCHLPSVGGAGGGGPCCPVGCGFQDRCCDAGETCVGPKGLCCSPGLKGCGNDYCCGATDTCITNPKSIPPFPPASCCPSGNTICNGACCPGADYVCNPQTNACCLKGTVCGNTCCDFNSVCVNSAASQCCDRAHACGSVCCNTGESCTDPNHGTCSPCSNCSEAGQVCCFGQCCSAPNYCDADSKSCKCPPNCAGKCGGAPDGCGGACTGACDELQSCYQQKCCQGDCAGKCGGAPDGCGGACNFACPNGGVCVGQSCCTPDCNNKSCGAGDGCGGRCNGYCAAGETCDNFVCTANCAGGRADCCGDGSCCLQGNQCYKCSCGGGRSGSRGLRSRQ